VGVRPLPGSTTRPKTPLARIQARIGSAKARSGETRKPA
jgi:hypothetical protein